MKMLPLILATFLFTCNQKEDTRVNQIMDGGVYITSGPKVPLQYHGGDWTVLTFPLMPPTPKKK